MMQQKEGNNKGQSIVFEVLSVIFPKFRTTFGAADKKDYSVVRAKLFQSSITLPDGKQLHHGDTIDVTGYGLPRKKSRIRVIGTPVKNKYNQWQFKADLVRLDVDLEEIIDVKRFLVENVRGVSEKTALAILSEFGDKTMDVLRNSPNELYRIKVLQTQQPVRDVRHFYSRLVFLCTPLPKSIVLLVWTMPKIYF